MTDMKCPLGEDCDMTIAWMMGAEWAKDTIKAQAAEIEKLRKDLSMAVFADSEYCKVLEREIERLRAALGNTDACIVCGHIDQARKVIRAALEGKQ